MVGTVILLVLGLFSLGSCSYLTPGKEWPDVLEQFQDAPTIVNGETADKGEFPFIVSLTAIRVSTGNRVFFCGGSIVTETAVITAGHCLNQFVNSSIPVTVYAGHHNISDTAEAQTSVMKKAIVHPRYTYWPFPFFIENDIAFAILETKLVFNQFVQPIHLPTSNHDQLVDEDVVAAGWGLFKQTPSTQPDLLQKLDMVVKSRVACQRAFGVWPRIKAMEICAHRPTSSICNGDSGGPLVFRNGTTTTLVGLTSWGSGNCTHSKTPGVFARVAFHLKWVNVTLAANSE